MANNTIFTSVDSIINDYLNRGFGTMTKNDFEVWIFNYLLQNRPPNTSNYDFSVELRIPESKVKRLRYEASLKYGNPADTVQYNEAFQKLLANVNLKKGSKNVIQFAVEDMQLRKYLDSILKKKGRFADTSFNSEVVSITIDDLAILLDATSSEEQKKELLRKSNENGPFIDIAKKALGKIVEKALEKGIATGIGIGLKALIEIFLSQ